jgi:hypothetical protein
MRVVFWRWIKNISNGTFVRDFECTYHYPKATIFRKCAIRVGLELFRVTECGVLLVLTFTCVGCFDCDWLHLCLASVARLVWSVSVDMSTTLEWRMWKGKLKSLAVWFVFLGREK